jgi:hypothetical protein
MDICKSAMSYHMYVITICGSAYTMDMDVNIYTAYVWHGGMFLYAGCFIELVNSISYIA